ncbi:hypothetical protein H6B15_12665 [Gemmiger formicilis]|uniref:hypothetical protein n=1 Tax=Gemmiger formicilis TaxID=745368 RepID=UPI00195EDB11|nr:hypothetical protein [Gemmiger formicilis]MBM6717507.1 hypothetical protein [Gemmiger formicilis]
MTDRNPYIGYEYRELTLPDAQASFVLDGYESFGWVPDPNRPARTRGRTVTLYLKRDRRIINRMELTRLQRHFEACLAETRHLGKLPGQGAALGAALLGILATAFVAGSVFAVTHTPPLYLLMVLLAVPGFAGWALTPFVYRRLLHARTEKTRPLLEAQYDQMDLLCRKGHDLL